MKSERGKFGKALIFAVIFVALAFVTVGCASAATYSVCPCGCNYTSIQAAINAADPCDTIEVHSSTYYENVDVTKPLILRGIDTGSGKPVVDAGGSGNAIMLSADGITLEGFNAINSGYSGRDAGIKVVSSNNNITGNNVSNNNWAGICLYDSSNNNSITGNNVCNNNRYGIDLWDSSNNNIIASNKFVNDGLFVYRSYKNTVEDNTVNGKPLVYLEDVSDIEVTNAGQVILVNCNNISVENLDLSNTCVGVELWQTEDSIISNNSVSNNNRHGIYLDDSSNNNITGNNVCNNNRYGIRHGSSCNNNITGNNVRNNDGGIYLWDSSNNNITGNNVGSNNRDGIHLCDSSNNNITGNNVSDNNEYGICLSSSSNNIITRNKFVNDGLYVTYSYKNTVEDNTVNGKPLVYLEDVSDVEVTDAGQVILVNCNNITVENLDLSSTAVGVELWDTEDSIISNNNVCNNWFGIYLWCSSNNNTITGNNVSNNDRYGIHLRKSCNNNSLTGNNISNNNGDGISLSYSSNNNTITGNNVSNNRYGIDLTHSSNNNIIASNKFVNDGLFVRASHKNTVEDNTVNGKPLVYLEDVSDVEVTDAGQVILVNCNNITVENLDLSSTSVGIELWDTEDSTISNNNASNNNRYGIHLSYSSNNSITGNNISNNNNGDGIYLYYSCNNNITGNNVSNNNDYGIYLYHSDSNKIFLNNFINNTDNVYFYRSNNIWKSTEKITYTYNSSQYTNYLGNYWDDYKERYPDAKEIDGTGIGDTPYGIDGDKDIYPLMEPWENYFAPAPSVFDTGAGTYPSIMGTHNGTITPSDNITVSKLYTYSCAGTGGHTGSIKLYGSSLFCMGKSIY